MAEIRVNTTGTLKLFDADDSHSASIKAGTLSADVTSITLESAETVFNEDSADIDLRVESNSNTHMLFIEGGTDRIGINESSPTTQLQITGATDAGGTISLKRPNTTVTAGQTLGGIEFITADSGSAGIAARILGEADGTGGEGKLVFATGTGGSTSTAWTITSGGDLLPGATDHGIHLGVTSAADSNLLDDYEEGTYTPVMTVASGSLTVHGSHNTLAYTKIGRVVHVQGEMRFSAVSSPSGNFSVSLPFAVADLAEGAARSTSGAIGQSGFGGTPDATYYLRITSEGTTTAFFATHNSGSDTGVNANQVSTSTEMIVSFTFIAA